MAQGGPFLPCLAFLLCISALQAIDKAPNVQVYSRHPVEIGKENTLHCYVERFHPPKIDITLMKDGVPIEDVQKSDLSFKPDWTFELLVHTKIIPDGKSEYACKVNHSSLTSPKIVKWDQVH
ncbi:beta-2-microglobulin-like isoform X2 [Sceloporus undulatus]|uniref:beta-2-microglobulin-like isoform X1 n=1 Tax=Sceloporus undulatus TaxID=8520 RepID=UPI001C4CA717|nr:beta-2-microglobulin-like isoform X1 [Sceloporus undulatus]XP_042331611.1 beta-2-microglobulin-like isoform X2 [Sceloporus undulatus]